MRRADPRLEVIYEPDLLWPPQYPADHRGREFTRTPEQDARWRSHLARAEVLLDFDKSLPKELPQLAANLRWIQATSSGVGDYVRAMGYEKSMPRTAITTCKGIHAGPLAEWAFMVMLAFHKKMLESLRDQRLKRWDRFAAGDLRGQTLVVVGMGRVGTEIARLGQAFGMRVIGIKRTTAGVAAADLHLDVLYGPADLDRALSQAGNLVLIAPRTSETEHMIGARQLALLPKGAVFVNIARGALVDEVALIETLRSGHLLGAGLDVFEKEPLPPESPLWEMENVIICPHSASTAYAENERITDLFIENLHLYLGGRPLLNQFNPALGF